MSSPPQQAILRLRELLLKGDPEFLPALKEETAQAATFNQALTLHNLRRKAALKNENALKIAIVGGPTLRPLADLIEHFTSLQANSQICIQTGEFDSYRSEIIDPESELYAFEPNIVLIIPGDKSCPTAPATQNGQREQAEAVAQDLLNLCQIAQQTSKAEVVLCNFTLPPNQDDADDYTFKKLVNLHLTLNRPTGLHICDAEFIANKIGTAKAQDDRAWFESKQPFSADMLLHVAREFAHLAATLKRPAKKVLVTDLDNTLWGGVVGDDGLEGIEIGTTCPRGEAFRHFQQYLLSLTQRGVLLAVCSKNDHDKALEPFKSHPEMLLKEADIVSFKANWLPKSDNIRQIAEELNLGLDSFVFVDDNPAEVEIVRQFLPEVTAICLGEDPSTFTANLKNRRLFQTTDLTEEDRQRSALYKQEAHRQQLKSQATDMDSYLKSLEMVAEVSLFQSLDAPRIAQLINKSNQFNLTTRRRTEAEVLTLVGCPHHEAFTIRLQDKFGPHGLVAVVIARIEDKTMQIDTWLMSCRVLKRGVEEETLNQILHHARSRGCHTIQGEYIPNKKNAMVADLYPTLGFTPIPNQPNAYKLNLDQTKPKSTHIEVHRLG